MHPLAWLDLPSLPSLERMVAEQFLESPAPVGVASRARTFREALAAAAVTASDYFNFSWVGGHASWGVLATADKGAIAVAAEVAKASLLPPLPRDLARIATKVGPVDDRLRRALLIAGRNAGDVELQHAVITAAIEHAELHERLRVWRPAA